MTLLDDSRKFGTSKKKKTKKYVRDKLPGKKRNKRINSQAKGKRGEKEALDLTSKVLNLTKDDIRRCVGQERGTDFKRTSDYCRDIFPFKTEVKNQEKPRFWECWAQAEHNAYKDMDEGHPLLLIKRNNQGFLAVVEYEVLLGLLKTCYDLLHMP